MEKKKKNKALSGRFNEQSKYAWYKPTSHMVGQSMSGVVEGRVTHKNELCYGCHNCLTHSIVFNDTKVDVQDLRPSLHC